MWLSIFRVKSIHPPAPTQLANIMEWNGREKSQPVTVGIGDGVDGEDGKLIAVRDEKNVNAVERIGFFFLRFMCYLLVGCSIC